MNRQQIGRLGAKKYRERMRKGIAKPRGFAHPDSDPIAAGRKGGTISKRGKARIVR